ncbi:MAG: RagB/SusD family nutrient uptake outer membrane protein [Mangrovibacterium sp.]
MKKRILIISTIAALLVACQSNEDFLKETPKGQLFPDNFLNNETELELMNNSLYGIFDRTMGRPYESMDIKFASSDDVLGTGNQRTYYNQMEVNMDITVGADNDIQLGWERAYNTINQANAIINNYHNADGTVAEDKLNAWAAQAHFIRAFTYFWLVRFYNNIPLITTAFVPDVKKEVTCSKAADIYALIVSDLQFAEQWLPVTWTGYMKKGGAVTKGAAKSTLAKVYLQMAGFPVNGGTEYYAKARDKAKEVIDNAAEYGYALRNHFYQVWDPYWSAYETSPDEAILWIEHTVDDYTARAPLASRPIEFGGWEFMIAENGFFNRFPAGERKDFTFITDFYINGGLHYTYKDLKCMHPCYRKLWADDLSAGWNWENRNDPSSLWASNMQQTANWFSSRAIVMLRYPDILLTYSEAKARTDGPDDLAYKCLNDVRNRAYKGVGTTEASVTGLSTEAFIDAVVWERAYEFAGMEYSARWFDLQRLELVEKATTEWRDETESKYTLVKQYTKKDYFLPIPSKEVTLNPNLANNNPEFQ